MCDAVFSDNPSCNIGLVCRSNADCDAGFTCDAASAQCTSVPLPGTAAIGEPCATGATCAGGLCRTVRASHPDGYCTAACVVLPDRSDTCPSGAICFAGNRTLGIGSDAFCYDLCDASATVSKFGPCRTAYTCSPLPADPRFGVCVPSS